MIVVLVRGSTVRVLRNITSVERRQFGDAEYALFQPRCMFTIPYINTYDAVVVFGRKVMNSKGDPGIHWIKEPRHD